MKIRVYVVEDEPIIAETIKSSLIKEGFDVIGQSSKIGQAYFEIDELKPDLVMLDITLEDGDNGIQLGKKLNAKLNIPFIYLSSHSDSSTVKEASKTNPAAYLLKPFRSKDLKVSIDMAMIELETIEAKSFSEFLFVKKGKKWVKINVHNIRYAKADDSYTEIFTTDEKFLISQSLKKVEIKLDPSDFRRTHRSYLVNLSMIEGIDEDSLIIGEDFIPIGKTYRKEVLDSLTFL